MNNAQQIELWKKLATIGAFAALSLIIFSYWIGLETWLKCVMVLICSAFTVVAIYWWYWALNQISLFSKYMLSLKTIINELKEDLKQLKKDI